MLHRHVPHGREIQKTIGSEVGAAVVRPHEVPSRPSQRQEMVLAVVIMPPALAADVFRQFDGQRVPRRVVWLSELARSVEAAVKWHVEQTRRVRVPSSTRMVLNASVEDHLCNELVGGEPASSTAVVG
ncbi:hypothetical protein U1Q18_002646 [Sarracenia purpurea var. burkii]